MPGAIHEAVARRVARLGVLGPAVDRVALVGPLLQPVVTHDNRPVAGSLAAVSHEHRRPVGGTRTVAHRLAGSVLVEGIERHALGTDEHAAAGGRRRHGRGFGSKDCARGKRHGDEGGKRERLQHDISSADVGLQEGDAGGGDLFRGTWTFFSTPHRLPPSMAGSYWSLSAETNHLTLRRPRSGHLEEWEAVLM